MDLRWQRPDKPNGFYGLKVSTDMMLHDNAVALEKQNRSDDVMDFNPYFCSITGYPPMFLDSMSFSFHKNLLFTLRISIVNPPFITFVLLFSRTASYCVRQMTRLTQWTGLSLHHVTDTYYKRLMSTCNPNWKR